MAEDLGASVELSGLPPNVSDELLTLYFENGRRSGGGPVLRWQRLGRGGVLTFQKGADASRVLAQEHSLCGMRLSLRPAPPCAPARLLLQGLPPGIAPQRLEQHVQALLRAAGLSGQPCHALDSQRPDCALVQLSQPLMEADICVLEEQASTLALEGASVSVARVPQARAVRVVGDTSPGEQPLLELYLENERRSGGGALEGLRSLQGCGGTVATFQQWQVAERVLQREHWLQGRELHLVPHYDILEPEGPAEDSSRGALGPDLPGTPEGAGTVTAGSEEAAWSPGAAVPAESVERLGQARPRGTPPRVGPGSPGLRPPSPAGQAGARPGSPAQGQGRSPGAVECPGHAVQVEKVLSIEPGALRFLQLHHADLLAGLGDVGLVPLEGSEVTGFRLCGAPVPCQAAEEFLQSLLGTVSCHTLSLTHPGSAHFLLSADGQSLLQDLETQFQCVFVTERLAMATLGTQPSEVDPTETLSHTAWTMDGTGSDKEDVSLEEVRELLATLGGQNGENWLPLEPGDKQPQEEEQPPSPHEEPTTPGPGAGLEEAAALQLALHRSLGPPGQEVAREEAQALQQALALSLLETPTLEADVRQVGGPESSAQLDVHVPFEQDVDALHRALEAALETLLQEETVELSDDPLPAELWGRLEQRYGVTVVHYGDRTVLRGFGEQPARAARHLAALLAGRGHQSLASVAVASDPTRPQPQLKTPLGRLESVAEGSGEFQEVVQAFYDTLDTAPGSIRVIRVERVSHPLLRHQYELHREQLEQRCERRPLEHVLYHGTSAAAVADICAHGFNRSFCGRNGTLYGQGVYFARRASLSVQDRYSPPDADGHKAVFVARVLTGDYAQGCRGLRAPPLRDPSGDVPLRFDSAVDCLRQPSIFVIFHDTQALPTHLITCQHLP
ncbi:protein mono-ADP-ribosyltransferase PARP10 [Sorex araneus]|uniref:protein mono-ADP-ribosyltransferase PARP10 n=1 Tax=Sorex araneus TaxID=42254 RepID=UPI002433B474|nr:protein mono-ADP-ribosyltransferase PARP10 [Sorex araneus]